MNIDTETTQDAGGVDDRIIGFIKRHHVMTLATVSGSEAYCANLFYAYIPESNMFVFTSDDKTRHYREMSENGLVAASIVLETRTIGNIQGLQIQGRASLAEGDVISAARKAYIRRFPYAVIAELTLWVLQPVFMKLTDNRLGFGRKLIWNILCAN